MVFQAWVYYTDIRDVAAGSAAFGLASSEIAPRLEIGDYFAYRRVLLVNVPVIPRLCPPIRRGNKDA